MAVRVPDTNTYSLLDVYNAVKDHAVSTTGDLSDCFSKAIPGYFDPTYNANAYALPNSLKRFRNYGPTGKVYEIEFLRIVDKPTSDRVTVNSLNMTANTWYYIEWRLNNPDSGAWTHNIFFDYIWDQRVPFRMDLTLMESYANYPNNEFKNIVIDNDFPLGLKTMITIPSPHLGIGDRIRIGISNNATGLSFLQFKITPYVNITAKKILYMNFLEGGASHPVSMIRKDWVFNVSYMMNSSMKMYWPNPVSHTGIFNMYGYNPATYYVTMIIQNGAETGPLAYFSNGGLMSIDLGSLAVVTGYYRFRLYDINNNLLDQTGQILVN